jgi:DNA repair exonuclease SbcCD ATPase subunit
MDENSQMLVNVNTAGEKELIAIPGLGVITARKIIAARPFASLDALLEVDGISRGLLERIRPYLEEVPAKTKKASPAKKTGVREPAPAPAEINETSAPEEEETLKEKIQDFISQQPEKLQDFMDEQPENFQKVKDFFAAQPEKLQEFLDDQPENIKKARDFIAAQPEKIQEFIAAQPERFEKVKTSTGMSNANLITLLIACLATLVLTILLTIGLMGAINGGLRYASQAEFSALNRQAAASASQLELLEKNTESIRARLDALESMSGRMKLIEEENTAIRKQLEESSRQVEEVRTQMEQIRADIESLQSSSNFFDRIISGLRTLLNETTRP